ncbi:MAG: type II and III secretion system protein family protein [Burkholderiales bacterium]
MNNNSFLGINTPRGSDTTSVFQRLDGDFLGQTLQLTGSGFKGRQAECSLMKFKHRFSMAAVVFIYGLISSTGAMAQSALSSSPCEKVSMGSLVNVAVGKSTIIKLNAPVNRILVGNPDQSRVGKPIELDAADDKRRTAGVTRDDGRPGVGDIDVLLLSRTEIYILGKGIGTTNVMLRDESGGCTLFDVIVGIDTAGLQAAIKQLLPGESNVTVNSAADSLVLTGNMSDAVAVDKAMALANAFVRKSGAGQGQRSDRIVNMLSVSAPQQVMLEVKVAEISKSLLDKLGVSLSMRRTNGSWTYSGLANLLTGSAGVFDAIKNATGEFVTIDAEKTDGLVRILAEPTVMAISGQEGSFLAGGKIFIPVSSTADNGFIRTVLEEKEFGVGVKFTPTVLEGGRINLKVAPEVSELNPEGVGISAFGGTARAILPSINTRRAATTVQLHDGQSFAIGGLIKNNITQNIRALPILGEIPILGALFRSSNFQTDKTELVFVVTPRLVKPLPPDYVLPTDNFNPPSRTEFFLGGRMEGISAAAKPLTSQPAIPAKPNTGFDIK